MAIHIPRKSDPVNIHVIYNQKPASEGKTRKKKENYIQKEKYKAENQPSKTTDRYIQGIDDKIGCQKNLEQH